MANLHAGLDAGDDAATGVSALFRARYPEMVRLADLLAADDPEDIAQEAFARLIRKHDTLRDQDAALAYVRVRRRRSRHLADDPRGGLSRVAARPSAGRRRQRLAAGQGREGGLGGRAGGEVYETNVFGVIAVTNAMLPLLRRAPAARIVNVSSEVGSITATTADGPADAYGPLPW